MTISSNSFASPTESISKVNTGQTHGRRGLDLNVKPVWQQGITGSGVVVSITDNGGCTCVHDIMLNVVYVIAI